jgi:hypothetical protein
MSNSLTSKNNLNVIEITPKKLVNALIAAPHDDDRVQLLTALQPVLRDFHDLVCDRKLRLFAWLSHTIKDEKTSPALKQTALATRAAIQILAPDLQILFSSGNDSPMMAATEGFSKTSLKLCIPAIKGTAALRNPTLPLSRHDKAKPIRAIRDTLLQLA